MDECIFCKIIRKEIPSNIVLETDDLVAFPDLHPASDVHILVVPKEHIIGVESLSEKHGAILSKVYKAIQELVDKNRLGGKYRIVTNGSEVRHVDHLHFHLLGGRWKRMV